MGAAFTGKLKDGTISQYGLLCGYKDRAENNGLEVELYHDCGVYAVRVFASPENGVYYTNWNDFSQLHYRAWLSFDNKDYANAKNAYKKIKTMISKGEKKQLKKYLKEQVAKETA